MAVTVSTITPTLGAQHATLNHVTITGTGFVTGLTIDVGGVDIVASDIVVASSTTIHCIFTIASGALTTTRDLTITNADLSTGTKTEAFTVTALAFSSYQPFSGSGAGYQRAGMLYDCRGDTHPMLYLGSAFGGTLWTVNRRTGAIVANAGQFNINADSPLDQESGGQIWWLGNDPLNLTNTRQSQTRFEADTLVRIGSATTDGSTIIYTSFGILRCDRHSPEHLVAKIDTADSHDIHGNLWVWDKTTRQMVYFLSRSSWYNEPVPGAITRVTDLDFDGDGNLWLASIDDSGTYVLLWKVEPDGTQTMVADLSSYFSSKGGPAIRWVTTDNSLVLGINDNIVKWSIDDDNVAGSMVSPISIIGEVQYMAFHHTLTDKDSIYLSTGWPNAPVFYEVDIVNLLTTRVIDFSGVSGVNGVFFNGFSQSYDTARNFRAYSALYDATAGGVWCEDFWQGVVGFFDFGDETVPPEDLGRHLFLLEHVEPLS